MQNGAASKVVTDLKNLIDDAESLMKASASDAVARIGELRERLREKFEQGKTALMSGKKNWSDTVNCAKSPTESYLHGHAWAALLVAVGVGAMFGLLARRK